MSKNDADQLIQDYLDDRDELQDVTLDVLERAIRDFLNWTEEGGSRPLSQREGRDEHPVCETCGNLTGLRIEEGESRAPDGPHPVRVCVVDGVAHVHYLGKGTDHYKRGAHQ